MEHSMSKTFVLCHGTWHGGWAWDEVVRCLSLNGHRACAPTLAGHGPGVECLGITHQDCVDSVAACIREHDLWDVVLVGHSFGGTVAQRVVSELPDRIARMVFLDALVLKDGERVFDVLPDVFLDSLTPKDVTDSVTSSEVSPEVLPAPPWETWRNNFIQDASESLARSTWERLSPEPNQVNLDSLDLERFDSLDIPKSFIHCRHDKAMPSGYFHPQMSSRLGTFQLIEMDGGHEVMFTRPAELAEKIIAAGGD
jgi:pimeloyl-ACP methyl ester carboxylesterase